MWLGYKLVSQSRILEDSVVSHPHYLEHNEKYFNQLLHLTADPKWLADWDLV